MQAAPAPAPKTPPPEPTSQRPKANAAKQPAAKPINQTADTKRPASAKAQSKAMAGHAVGSMMSQMREAAAQRGGMLSMQDLDAMEAQFAQQTKQLENQFKETLEDYADAREKARLAILREDPFSRLLVSRFSSLLEVNPGRKNLSRRMLPGFHLSLEMVLGPDTVEQYHERCRAILARVQGGDDDFDWDEFYTQKDILTVSLDTQLLMAAQFADYDRRMLWFVNMVNANLSAPAEDAGQDERHWEMTEIAFRRFLAAFTTDLRKVISTDVGREQLAKRHGSDKVADAVATLKRLVTG